MLSIILPNFVYISTLYTMVYWADNCNCPITIGVVLTSNKASYLEQLVLGFNYSVVRFWSNVLKSYLNIAHPLSLFLFLLIFPLLLLTNYPSLLFLFNSLFLESFLYCVSGDPLFNQYHYHYFTHI